VKFFLKGALFAYLCDEITVVVTSEYLVAADNVFMAE